MSIGGVEKVIVNTLNGIDYSIFDVTLFIMYKTEGEISNIKKIPAMVNIQYLFNKPPKGAYQRILYYLFMFFPHTVINSFIVKESYDIIVTTKDVFSYPISVNKCKKVMWIHGGLEYLETENPSIFNKIKIWYKNRTYSKFNHILLLTNAAKKRFCNKYGTEDRCHVLYNPINNDEITKLSNEAVLDYEFKSDMVIICSCRLSIEKGVDRLLDACNKLFQEGYNFNLIILGDGPEKVNLMEKIQNNPLLNNKVAMLGFKENPYKYISKCNIYISPSITEGFSLSIAEAMILDLPIISTNCNGPKEILENGKYGLLVENTENGIYQGLKKIISNRDLIDYYRLKSGERKEFFSYEKNIRALEGILKEG
ncbi:glycosyltransferase [Bacillus sp. FJAT-49754]|uniref:Glycosyltransferase n=2 Tax=Lederbergia citrea TaxID=2833581 RepID=A0A942URC5_9BACI|nr:glycosyltransferase [Lederbergia citrea]MBS4224752.1 glycosyltransferase [Lederbergia citrea]